MNAQGTVYMSKLKPQVNKDLSGKFMLSLVVIDRIGPHRTESWHLFWNGDQAKEFWEAHAMSLTAGTALDVEVERICPHTIAKSRHADFTEIHAVVKQCSLVERQPMRMAA
jgi:hypothetical protein